jgi:cation/acetate symporter
MIIPIAAVAAVTLATIGIGTWGVRFARTTSDLYVASRAMSPWWNAAAISGEYLSVASFLGIAGLEMQIGVPALWQAIGFAAGYLALLLFVAAPLRRFGSYTLPDFAEGRLASPRLRNLAVAAVLAIDTLYLIPQLKGAGIASTSGAFPTAPPCSATECRELPRTACGCRLTTHKPLCSRWRPHSRPWVG